MPPNRPLNSVFLIKQLLAKPYQHRRIALYCLLKLHTSHRNATKTFFLLIHVRKSFVILAFYCPLQGINTTSKPCRDLNLRALYSTKILKLFPIKLNMRTPRPRLMLLFSRLRNHHQRIENITHQYPSNKKSGYSAQTQIAALIRKEVFIKGNGDR